MILHYSQINLNTLKNSILKEYMTLKSEHKDAIIFYQMGDFFETFFLDARILSETTNIILSSRTFKGVGAVAEAGIPKKALETYIKKLLNANYKVCVCRQFKGDEDKITRKLVRKYTKGTLNDSEFLENSENNYILSVYKKNDYFYMAYADASTGQLYKTDGNLLEILYEIEKIEPSEIIISNKQIEVFEKYLDKYLISYIDEDYFKKDKIEKSIIDYCKMAQQDYFSDFEKPKRYSINSFVAMDNMTRQNLELTRTKRNHKKKGSIFWFLNNTKTFMGARLLKKVLNEPLLNIEQIKSRQEAINELINGDNDLGELEEKLSCFCDLSRICSCISNSTILPKDLYKISKSSMVLYELNEMCEKYNSQYLKFEKEKLEDVLVFISTVQEALHENSSDELKSGNIISPNYNANLDYLREQLEYIKSRIEIYAKKEASKLKIDKMKLSYSRIIGYYLEVPNSKNNLVPAQYIKKQTLTNVTRYTTPTIKEYEDKIYTLSYQINELEYELFVELRKMARHFVSILREIAENIAVIDVFVSFAKCALENNFTRPIFNKKGMYVKDAYHPSLIKLNNEVIKNDTNLDNGTVMILTGANMSGKSTYLKQNAIIYLLSQIGCFVPAKCADIDIIDKIFLRQGSSDDIINNNSSFMVEMEDLKYITDNATNSSLILLDEPAKSTTEIEGGAISCAFIEYVIKKIKAKTIIVTHNIKLTELEKRYNGIIYNYVMSLDGTSREKNRKITRGIFERSYAINTAILADLPEEIIENAKKYLSDNV